MKKAFFQMHLAVLLWGITAILGRLITLDAPVLVWYRMLLTAVFTIVILWMRSEKVRPDKKGIQRLSFIGLLMALHWVAFYASIKTSNISVAVICLSTASIFTSVLDPLINKTRFKKHELVLGAFALAGVSLIYHFEIVFSKGILLGIIAAMLSALFTVLNKRIAHEYPSRTMVFYEMGTGWLFLCLMAPVYYYYNTGATLLPAQTNLLTWIKELPQSFTTPNDWVWLCILSLCCTVWAQSLALNALKKLSSFTVCLSVNLEPVYGILLAFLFFHENEHFSPVFYWGMALIAASVVLQILYVFGLGRKKHI